MIKECLAAAFSLILCPGALFSAVIWQEPQDIVGNSDVVVQGDLLGAYAFYTDVYPQGLNVGIINGITFRTIAPNSTYGHLTTSGFDGADNVFGSNLPPFASLDAQYRSILEGAHFDDHNTASPAHLLFSDLNENTAYLVQIWASDSREGSFRQQILGSPGGENSSLMTFRRGPAGALGQYVIGTFTTGAGVTSQEITFATNSLQVNTLQIRAIPEPTSAALLVSALAGLMLTRRTWRRFPLGE